MKIHINKVLFIVLVPILIVVSAFTRFITVAIANEPAAITNKIEISIESKKVDREARLKKYLEKRKSPMVANAKTLEECTDKNNLDYRLLVVIGCLESSCGIHMPQESYNAWGWGVYETNVRRFANFDEGIKRVGEGLYENYTTKGLDTPAKISRKYNPPTHESWAGKISYFMNDIDKIIN